MAIRNAIAPSLEPYARWDRLDASYMQFGSVNLQMKSIVESVLAQPQHQVPKTLVEFWQKVSITFFVNTMS